LVPLLLRPDRYERANPPNDENAEDLKARTLAAREHPGAFLSNALVFAGLGEAPRFAEAFEWQLRSLWQGGTEATLPTFVREASSP
jgi:mannitol 2-dehydrogenase